LKTPQPTRYSQTQRRKRFSECIVIDQKAQLLRHQGDDGHFFPGQIKQLVEFAKRDQLIAFEVIEKDPQILVILRQKSIGG